ncbi:TetR/AcrR family transcriptional regulator [Caenibacillus caldisaponilyticus]|uniref:TetR/AcrR family transcriptional regulator n=1 Tax=Caenibacillus caldisaponilyticus TaxID=1674942 RepID=UPI00098884AC|nr:TetR/AcrR family transcriptional regulator [Caenibacillus caldisaponilyticus]
MAEKNVQSTVKDEALIKKRRDQLVKAAVSLIKIKGFHRTTTREIARAAGFSIGTLYEYIRTKEDVLYLVCDDIYNKVSSRLKTAIALKRDGVLSLKEAIKGCVNIMDEMQDEVLVMYQEAKSLAKDALPYVLNKEMEMVGLFEEVLEHGVASGHFQLTPKEKLFYAHHILVQCQMWAFRRWGLAPRFTVREFADLLAETIVSGLINREKPGPVDPELRGR